MRWISGPLATIASYADDVRAEWEPGELTRIAKADELQLSSQRRDGSLRDPVTIWVVRDGDDLYVRSMHGSAGAWFRHTQARRQGHIRSAGIDKDVAFFVDADAALNERIDAAYRDKYARYGAGNVGAIVNPNSRAATIRLVPK